MAVARKLPKWPLELKIFCNYAFARVRIRAPLTKHNLHSVRHTTQVGETGQFKCKDAKKEKHNHWSCNKYSLMIC